METFVNATFGIFDMRANGMIVSLRTSGLQRFVTQNIANRPLPITAIQIPILIRFKSPDQALPTPPRVDSPSIRSGPPSNVSEAEHLDQVSELPVSSPVIQQVRNIGLSSLPGTSINPVTVSDTVQGIGSVTDTPTDSSNQGVPGSVPGTRTAFRDDRDQVPGMASADRRVQYAESAGSDIGPNFRGNPISSSARTNSSSAHGSDTRDNYYDPHESRYGANNAPPRRGPLFDHTAVRTPKIRTPTRSQPYSDEVTDGPETFQDYMSQFQFSEVKYKDFRKVTIPKFDASRNDSFVHWYKFLVSTCLQWGVWCPPYESVEEDNVHGCWWMLLPQSVRDQKSFMGHLLYSLLI